MYNKTTLTNVGSEEQAENPNYKCLTGHDITWLAILVSKDKKLNPSNQVHK